MTRISALALTLAHLFACTQGNVDLESTDADETVYPTVKPLFTASTGGSCDASLEHRPDNRCDGEELLGLDLIAVSDADGDGRWEAGEELTVQVEFYTTNTEGEDHINYPRVFVDGTESVVESSDSLNGVGWFYAIMPGEPIPLTYILTARDDASGETELVFTVGAMNCEGNESWGACPTPSPLFIQLAVE